MKKFILFALTVLMLSSASAQALKPKQKEKIISEHPEWSIEDIELIRNGKIRIGMTMYMVQVSWGKAKFVSETANEFTGRLITWSYYSLYKSGIKTVTFNEEGEVTMYQDFGKKNNP